MRGWRKREDGRGAFLSAEMERFARCGVFIPRFNTAKRGFGMGIIWTVLIGFVAGVIAKFVTPGSNEPSGFILTTVLGILGAFVATYLGQSMGWYGLGEGAGLIGAVIGAVIVLLIWGFASRRA